MQPFFLYAMKIFYSTSVFFYSLLIKIAANFNKKADLRYQGVKKTFEILKNANFKKLIWIHCASLGEFEQGRPIIERIKKEKPDYQIALSFFSPSGYEIQKNYEFADIVFYLPGDSKSNAKKIIQLLQPELVFFIKYEFWYWYLSELKKANIPTYLVSGIFRKNQIFFKFYGSFYRNILKNFKHIFVQNETSKSLLKTAEIENVSVTGDTRFDRVSEFSKNRKENDIVESFTKDKLVFIAGSTWKQDEELIFKYFNNCKDKSLKLIIAPHEVKSENIERIINLSTKKILRFSEANEENISDADILLIDNIGLLSSLYAYADIAYIGGGFGSGIHNTLEAAVFGMPIIFGPNYQKFDEAKELIKRKSAFSVSNYNDFAQIVEKLTANSEYRKTVGNNSEVYVKENVGATEKVLKEINQQTNFFVK